MYVGYNIFVELINYRMKWWGFYTPPQMKMVAQRIKSLREQKGLTQSTLARKIGITRSSVNA